MSAYIVADVTVTDPEAMARYREWSTRAMQEHGATPTPDACAKAPA
jgi:uncharacterized protein (DUF1330 family)